MNNIDLRATPKVAILSKISIYKLRSELESHNMLESDILKRYNLRYLEEVPSNLYKEIKTRIIELRKRINSDRSRSYKRNKIRFSIN